MVGPTWKQAVADELARLYRPGQDFLLTDLYAKAEDRLQAMYPSNGEVQATIRQILQRHRDAGLVKFHGNGHYTYLGTRAPERTAQRPARPELTRAVYDLAARITDETNLAATEYLAIARSSEAERLLAALLTAHQASPTFLALNAVGRLDLSIERLTIQLAGDYALDVALVCAATDRLTYFQSESD